MSLWCFMIGISVVYYLFTNYHTSKSNKNLKEMHLKRHTLLDDDDGDPSTLGSVFKRFIRRITDPINSNYLHEDGEKMNSFLFRPFMDKFQFFEDVSHAMKEVGLDKCRLILGIDFTASNEWQGSKGGHSLHHISHDRGPKNPYQHTITVLGHTLKNFITIDDDPEFSVTKNTLEKDIATHSGIPAFGFGDMLTKDEAVFSLRDDGNPCCSFTEVLKCYIKCVHEKVLGGPTCYAPVIRKAIEIVQRTNHYHILIIIADGQFVNATPTMKAIADASFYPLSIIVVGVGDGPWDVLHRFDDWLPIRQFDNFQFVEYSKIVKEAHGKHVDPLLSLHMFMEIPDQYKMLHRLGYIS